MSEVRAILAQCGRWTFFVKDSLAEELLAVACRSQAVVVADVATGWCGNLATLLWAQNQLKSVDVEQHCKCHSVSLPRVGRYNEIVQEHPELSKGPWTFETVKNSVVQFKALLET
jgi:hypothetical protein